MAHASLRDVAERAGVSFQTAGKVLNGEGRVAPATRQRILDAAADLGYVPNTVARSLKTARTHSIGFLGSGLASYVLTPLIRGVEHEATAQGYFPVFTLASGDGAHAERLVRQLLERRVDGIVSAALAHQRHEPLNDLLRSATPSVSAFADLGNAIPMTAEDAPATGALVGAHLLGLGHRRLAAIPGAPVGPGHLRSGRLDAFAAAIGVAEDDPWWGWAVACGDWSAAGGAAAMAALLDRDPGITAVFALNDAMAIGAMHTLRARGLRVPEDVSVIGCDDLPEAAFTAPPLTTVRISFEAIGATATRLLLSRIIAPEAEVAARTTLPVALIVRSSTGRARAV